MPEDVRKPEADAELLTGPSFEDVQNAEADADLFRLVPPTDSKSTQIIRLWALCQIDYQGIAGIGKAASRRLDQILDRETVNALFQISGFCLASPTGSDYLKLLKR